MQLWCSKNKTRGLKEEGTMVEFMRGVRNSIDLAH